MYIYFVVYLQADEFTKATAGSKLMVIADQIKYLQEQAKKVSIAKDRMSRIMRKPAFCICENKGTDQLCDNRTADQLLCFCYIDSAFLLLSESEIQASNHLLWSYSPVCVRSDQKPRRQVFSQCRSNIYWIRLRR